MQLPERLAPRTEKQYSEEYTPVDNNTVINLTNNEHYTVEKTTHSWSNPLTEYSFYDHHLCFPQYPKIVDLFRDSRSQFIIVTDLRPKNTVTLFDKEFPKIPESIVAAILKQLLPIIKYVVDNSLAIQVMNTDQIHITANGELKLSELQYRDILTKDYSTASQVSYLFTSKHYTRTAKCHPHRDNVWAVGIGVYSMLQGQVPHQNARMRMSLVQKIQNSPPPKLDCTFSEHAQSFVDLCLCDTPPTIDELMNHSFLKHPAHPALLRWVYDAAKYKKVVKLADDAMLHLQAERLLVDIKIKCF